MQTVDKRHAEVTWTGFYAWLMEHARTHWTERYEYTDGKRCLAALWLQSIFKGDFISVDSERYDVRLRGSEHGTTSHDLPSVVNYVAHAHMQHGYEAFTDERGDYVRTIGMAAAIAEHLDPARIEWHADRDRERAANHAESWL